MLRSLAGLLVLSLFLVGLAGCGGDDAKSKPTIQKTTQATENSKAATKQKQTSE